CGACGATPSFFCRLGDDVVYLDTKRFSRETQWCALCAISAPSWKPDRISLSLPGYQLMSPIAKIPGTLVSKAEVSTGMSSLFLSSKPQLATGPSFMVSPKNGSSASYASSCIEPSLPLTTALLS